MARLYSQLLYYAHQINTGTWTVPTGFVWVVRDIAMFAGAPVAGGTAQLIDQASSATYWYGVFTPGVNAAYVTDTNRRIILPEGFTTDIQIDSGLGAGADVWISGYALSLP